MRSRPTSIATCTSPRFAVASAAPPGTAPGKNPLLCSEVLPENCTIVNKSSAVIDTRTGGGAAVYYEGFSSSWYGVKTSLVKDLSNNVSGDPLGIDPRWSIPLDDRTNPTAPAGYTDYFVFVSFATCNDGAGLVAVINDPTCAIVTPTATYPNWSQFTGSEEDVELGEQKLSPEMRSRLARATSSSHLVVVSRLRSIHAAETTTNLSVFVEVTPSSSCTATATRNVPPVAAVPAMTPLARSRRMPRGR